VPSHGRSGWFSQTQPQSSQRRHFIKHQRFLAYKHQRFLAYDVPAFGAAFLQHQPHETERPGAPSTEESSAPGRPNFALGGGPIASSAQATIQPMAGALLSRSREWRSHPDAESIGSRSRLIVNSILSDCRWRQLSTSVWYRSFGKRSRYSAARVLAPTKLAGSIPTNLACGDIHDPIRNVAGTILRSSCATRARTTRLR